MIEMFLLVTAVLAVAVERQYSNTFDFKLHLSQIIENDDARRLEELLSIPNYNASLNAGYVHAAEEGKLGLVYVFLNDSRVEPNALHNLAFVRAAYYGRIQVIDHLLSLGPRINPFDRWNNALIYSASGGHVAVVDRILNISNDQRRRLVQDDSSDTKWNYTLGVALKSASETGRAEVVQLLLDKGAALNRNASYHTIEEVYTKYEDLISKKELVLVEDTDSSSLIIHNILAFNNHPVVIEHHGPAEDFKAVLDLLVLKAQQDTEIINEIFENARKFNTGLYNFLLYMPQINPDIIGPFKRKRVRFKELPMP